MKNWKTTLGGLITALGLVLPNFGITPAVADAIAILGIAVLSWFSKDKNISDTK